MTHEQHSDDTPESAEEMIRYLDGEIARLNHERDRLKVGQRLANFVLVKEGYISKRDFSDFFIKYRYPERIQPPPIVSGTYRLLVANMMHGELNSTVDFPARDSPDIVCGPCGEVTAGAMRCNAKSRPSNRHKGFNENTNYLIRAEAIVECQDKLPRQGFMRFSDKQMNIVEQLATHLTN